MALAARVTFVLRVPLFALFALLGLLLPLSLGAEIRADPIALVSCATASIACDPAAQDSFWLGGVVPTSQDDAIIDLMDLDINNISPDWLNITLEINNTGADFIVNSLTLRGFLNDTASLPLQLDVITNVLNVTTLFNISANVKFSTASSAQVEVVGDVVSESENQLLFHGQLIVRGNTQMKGASGSIYSGGALDLQGGFMGSLSLNTVLTPKFIRGPYCLFKNFNSTVSCHILCEKTVFFNANFGTLSREDRGTTIIQGEVYFASSGVSTFDIAPLFFGSISANGSSIIYFNKNPDMREASFSMWDSAVTYFYDMTTDFSIQKDFRIHNTSKLYLYRTILIQSYFEATDDTKVFGWTFEPTIEVDSAASARFTQRVERTGVIHVMLGGQLTFELDPTEQVLVERGPWKISGTLISNVPIHLQGPIEIAGLVEAPEIVQYKSRAANILYLSGIIRCPSISLADTFEPVQPARIEGNFTMLADSIITATVGPTSLINLTVTDWTTPGLWVVAFKPNIPSLLLTATPENYNVFIDAVGDLVIFRAAILNPAEAPADPPMDAPAMELPPWEPIQPGVGNPVFSFMAPMSTDSQTAPTGSNSRMPDRTVGTILIVVGFVMLFLLGVVIAVYYKRRAAALSAQDAPIASAPASGVEMQTRRSPQATTKTDSAVVELDND